MKTAAFAMALLMSGAAIAQTTTYSTTTTKPDVDFDVGVQPDGDLDVDADVGTKKKTTLYTTADIGKPIATGFAASGTVVQASNASPEHDARGIAVISDPAVVPAGWNGTVSDGTGGPLLDPVTGEAVDGDEAGYPACSVSVTDNCLQTYERGRTSK